MLTLYGDNTTNTHKVTIALAELDLDYKKVKVEMARDEQMQDWFIKLSPNHKFPVLNDDTTGVTVWESGAVLIYLCEQYDQDGWLLARDGVARYAALQGSFFQAANIGPTLGRLNNQLTAPDDKKIPGMLEQFYAEAVRLAEVMDRMLGDDRPFLAGDYSIADIMHYPWLKAGLDKGFPALVENPRLTAWLGRIGERAAVKKGMDVKF
jgi:GSH-dependent disulfide-bond oxidoreductase